MAQGSFENLPSDTTINILSRLPARNATRCKCVCKPWLNLLGSKEFAKSHMSRSIPGLALLEFERLTILEFGDDLEHDENPSPIPLLTKTSLQMATRLSVLADGSALCSANGLLLLSGMEGSDISALRHGLWICNPITREFIDLHCPNPKEDIFSCCRVGTVYGFGASKISGQLKVVKLDQHPHESEAHVYVLGTGSWRRIAGAPPFHTYRFINDVFVNGKLHWLMQDAPAPTACQCIYTFDLETEVFGSLISPPPSQPYYMGGLTLGAVGDSLGVCDGSVEETVIVWVMKEYGDEKSWTKEFVIRRITNVDRLMFVSPVVILKDGEILVANAGRSMLYYTRNKRRGWRLQHKMKPNGFILSAVAHTSTFLSLKTFKMERVKNFS